VLEAQNITHLVEQFFALFHWALLFFDTRWIQVYTTGVHTFLGSARGSDRVDKEDEHDLSHEVVRHKNGFSPIRPGGGIDCKNAGYTSPIG
jgi:hypothetical protein